MKTDKTNTSNKSLPRDSSSISSDGNTHQERSIVNMPKSDTNSNSQSPRVRQKGKTIISPINKLKPEEQLSLNNLLAMEKERRLNGKELEDKYKVLKLLYQEGSLTQLEIFKRIGTFKGNTRICEFIQEGYPIVSEWEVNEGSGKRYKRYYLIHK